ncbi:hypothetical protein [Streptomyces sp. OE57]|uniref:mycothiol-dependent nitroreductase Rv2466c family protein n=1 Tax=Streptomyces lacaronensis TaxID=3379885 RepID=UPI0039B73741
MRGARARPRDRDGAGRHKRLDITWHVISPAVLNETRLAGLPEHIRDLMDRAWAPVRTVIAAKIAFGADALEPLHTALGTRCEGITLGRRPALRLSPATWRDTPRRRHRGDPVPAARRAGAPLSGA